MNWLKGKHPLIVHLVVGLWPMALIFDLLSRGDVGGAALARLSFVCITGGLIAALPAIATGALDWAEVRKEKPAWKVGLMHMLLNLIVYTLFALNFALRLRDWAGEVPVTDPQLILSLSGTILLLISAWLGGRMTFQYGVGVARQSKEKWRAIAESANARVPEQKEKSTS